MKAIVCRIKTVLVALALFSSGCALGSREPVPGPDQQGAGLLSGAALGAGAGAVTGAQLTAGAGPGAWVGAGLGLVYGMFSGMGIDILEESELERQDELTRARQVTWVQEVLQEHYTRRLELHPNRDIYPADWFFDQDEVKLKDESQLLTHEIGKLTRRRVPWSRIVVAAYVTAADAQSSYALYLTRRRAENIANEFIRFGFEPRRVQSRGIVLNDPVLIDPDDSPDRYRQAIEIIAVDR